MKLLNKSLKGVVSFIVNDNHQSYLIGLMSFLFILIIVTHFFVRLLLLNVSVIHGDEYAFAYVARGYLQGFYPHDYFFEHKPFGLSLIFYSMFYLLGDSLPVMRMIPIALITSSAVFVYLIMSNSGAFRRDVAIFATALFLVFSMGATGESFASDSECIVNFFMLASIYFVFIRKSIFIGGVLAGFAVSVNYLSGPLVFLLYAYQFLKCINNKDLKSVIVLAFSIVIGFLFHIFPILLKGDIQNYLVGQYRFLSVYNSLNYFRAHDFWILMKIHWGISLMVLVSVVCLTIIRKAQDACFYFFYLIFSVLVAMAPGPYWPHYFILTLPPAVLLIATVLSEFDEKRIYISTLIIAIIYAAPNAYSFAKYGASSILEYYKTGDFDYIQKFSKDFQSNCKLSSKDRVFVYSNKNEHQGLNFSTGTRPATSPGWNQPFDFLGESIYQASWKDTMNSIFDSPISAVIYSSRIEGEKDEYLKLKFNDFSSKNNWSIFESSGLVYGCKL